MRRSLIHSFFNHHIVTNNTRVALSEFPNSIGGKMRKYIFILSLVFFIQFNSSVNSQSLKLGFRFEPAILISEQNNSSSISFTPYSFYLTTILEPFKDFGFELRAGYFLGGEYYGGFELGAFARWMILSSKFYVIGGVVNHSNDILGSHNGGSGLSKNILYKSIGIGFQKDSKLSFDLMYYFTNDKDYAYSSVYYSYGNYRFENKQMNGILKVGFSLAWDIL